MNARATYIIVTLSRRPLPQLKPPHHLSLVGYMHCSIASTVERFGTKSVALKLKQRGNLRLWSWKTMSRDCG